MGIFKDIREANMFEAEVRKKIRLLEYDYSLREDLELQIFVAKNDIERYMRRSDGWGILSSRGDKWEKTARYTEGVVSIYEELLPYAHSLEREYVEQLVGKCFNDCKDYTARSSFDEIEFCYKKGRLAAATGVMVTCLGLEWSSGFPRSDRDFIGIMKNIESIKKFS